MTSYTNLVNFVTRKGEIARSLQHAMYYTQSLIGDYKLSARSSDLLGWMVCDGRTLAIADYPALYDVIGTSFGAPSEGYFKLPDFRGRVPGIIGTGSGLTGRALGDIVGAETHTLTINEMPSHNHGGATGAAGWGANTQSVTNLSGDDAADNAGTHTHTIESQGGGLPHNNMQPTLFGGNVFIFAGLDTA